MLEDSSTSFNLSSIENGVKLVFNYTHYNSVHFTDTVLKLGLTVAESPFQHTRQVQHITQT